MKRILSVFLLFCICLPFLFASCAGKGEAISVYIGEGLLSFDPVKDNSKVAQSYISNLFSGLYEYREDKDGISCLVPADADGMPSVEELGDGKSKLTFVLREGLLWSNGEPITPQDYVYSWNRAAEYSLYNDTKQYFSAIDGYESYLEYENDASLNMSYDNKTRRFSVVIEGDVARFLSYTTQTVFFPISRIAERDSKDWSKNVEDFASNGPFTLKEIKKDRVIFKKNENFRDAANVSVKEITFLYDREEAKKQQKKGKLAFCAADALTGGDSTVSANIGIQYLAFNISDSALALFDEDEKQKIRTALGIYILVEHQTSGLIPCFEDDSQTKNRDKQALIEHADSLLEQVALSSGRYTYQNGAVYEFPFLKALCAGRDGERAALERISTILSRKGIHVSIVNASWEDFIEIRQSEEWSFLMNAWIYDTASPTELLYRCLADSPYNDALAGSKEKPQFWRDEYDSLLSGADDIAEYKTVYEALKATGAVIPLTYITKKYAISEKTQGITVLPDGVVRLAYTYQE